MSDVESVAADSEFSLGKALRSKREARGMSIEDVSHHLKIDPALIQAFEEEREPSHNLPEVYCKGFLRNYARFVGVEVDPGQIRACRTADIQLGSGGDLPYQQKGSRWPLWLLLVAGAGYAAWHYLSQQPELVPLSETDSSVEQQAAPAAEAPHAEALAPAAVVEEGESEAMEGAEREPEPTPEAEAAQEEVTSSAETEAPQDEAEQPPQREAAESVVESVEARSAAAAADEDSQESAARGTVTVRYVDRSFTQITDGMGRVLVKRTLDAGAVEEFEGILPLQINLGNAIGVRVQFNGEAFDHLNYIDDNNIAQFTLGAEE